MTQDTNRHTAFALIEKISLCMLVTHNGRGDELRARPMSAHVKAGDDSIYLLTDVRNHKDDEIDGNQHVCLTFTDAGAHKYVSVTGMATVTNDRRKIEELWSIAARAWWDGKDDPNIRVVRVTPSQAEYWDGPGAVVATVKMAVSAMTGNRPQLGENKKVQF